MSAHARSAHNMIAMTSKMTSPRSTNASGNTPTCRLSTRAVAAPWRFNQPQSLPPGFDAHAVEAAVHKDHGDGEEEGGQACGEGRALLFGNADGQRDGQQAEQGGELDNRVKRH